jgi:hypothetical protein
VTFEKSCAQPVDGADPKAKLLKVETLSGQVILDAGAGIAPVAGSTYLVATLDFLAAGGSGYDAFKGVPVIQDLGIVREVMTDYFLATPARFTTRLDERWKQIERSASSAL